MAGRILARLLFDTWYRLGRPPWDTGISPPELTAAVAAWPGPPGRALDLGCGTGTNVTYLAQQGWRAVGVDFSAPAIDRARRKARAAGLEGRCAFYRADVTDLSFLEPPFDLALDIGCLHLIDAAGRLRYAAGLARLLRPGGRYLLYAFRRSSWGRPGLRDEDVLATLRPAFRLLTREEGRGPPSAWYTFERGSA